MSADPVVLLEAAVAALGGVKRPGQVQMVEAVQEAVERRRHLLVQAGTGTGKSLGYLVPAVLHAFDTGRPAVVATATVALQAQIVDRDLPRLAEAIAPRLGRRPTSVLVKGRRNYLCRHKLGGGYPDEDDGLLSIGAVDASASRLAGEVLRLREWAEVTASGDRDELVPGVSERAWRQVSVSAHECLGSRCPMVAACFVEQARAEAHDVDVVVTNHSFMAIDAFEGRQMLPPHDLLVVDEAHELVDRVTSTITDELTGAAVTAAAKKTSRYADTADLAAAGDALGQVLEELGEGRLVVVPEHLRSTLALVLSSARAVQSAMKGATAQNGDAGDVGDGSRAAAKAAVDDVFDVAERLLAGRDLDVAWVSGDPRRGKSLQVAPMSVAGLLRERVFSDRTVVLTSATLELGGSFDAVAANLGLGGPEAPAWSGLDVGSPFDYPRQAVAYVAAHLPPPGRDGIGEPALDEIEALVRAAGGRTLGLFSSMRAAQTAAQVIRARLAETTPEIPVLVQGEDQTATLVRQFARDARTCLFGTLSLWQGVDVPGPACQLVVIDRIPFPRPDDPLASARTQAVARSGGNGFMAVSAAHAALRLAQGAGRLVRTADDRGVVAILDSRMVSARYAGFLQASLPPFWPTTDRALVLAALARLDASAGDVVPVPEPTLRSSSSPAASDADPTGTPTVPDAGAPVSSARSTGAPVARSPRTAVTGGHSWSPEEDEELRDGIDVGLPLEDLAEHLEVPASAVALRARTLGLQVMAAPSLDFG